MAKFPRVGRDETLKFTYNVITTRMKQRAASSIKSDRLNNPLLATLATTGGGKSFFLDELSKLCPEDLAICEDETMRKILQNSVS